MATVRIINNILEDKVDTFSVNPGLTVEALIREHTDGDSYDGQLVECYDLDTGETYFAPIESNAAVTNAIVQVNGKDVGLDYEIQENDIVAVIITPAGDDWSWGGALFGAVEGAIIGGLIGNAVVPGIGAVVGALIGGGIGFLFGGLIGSLLSLDSDGSSNSGLDTEQLPDVRGSQNQPLTDQPYPMVLGKHLVTPFIIGSPWNEISGDRGQTNYIHILYAVGYAPLRLTDFKLGEMFLAHNQSWSGNKDLKNIFHGTLSGIDEGSGEDLLKPYQENTSIDLYHRPLIDAATMRASGWTEVEDDEIATVYSSGFSNEQGTVTVLVTPILANGTVLTPAQLEDYANRLLNNEVIDVDILLCRFTGNDSIEQSNTYGEGLHEAQEAYYFGVSGGDIVNTWSNNDVTLEILQQGQDGQTVDYGTVYPYAKIQEDVGANVLFIADGDIVDVDKDKNITYKGIGLQNGLRNNPVRFSEQFAKSLKVELDFKSGLYKTRSEKDDDDSVVKYYRIPMWVAIQWRVYSQDNESSSGEYAQDDIPLPQWVHDDENDVWYYDEVTTHKMKDQSESITGNLRGWHTFKTINSTIGTSVYTVENCYNDFAAHTGNDLEKPTKTTTTYGQVFTFNSTLKATTETVWDSFNSWTKVSGDDFPISKADKDKFTVTNLSCTQKNAGERYYYKITFTVGYSTSTWTNDSPINSHWINKEIFNLESLGGTNSDTEGLNEIRCVTEVDLVQWARDNLYEDGDSEETFVEKFKSYFLGDFNTTKSIEVRVVRVSPCYLDETKSTKEHSAYKFNDVFTWTSLTTEMLDGDKLVQDNQIVQKRPLEEDRMRKLCVVSLKAKTDSVDQLSNTLKKFTCIAQSFAPYYDDEHKQWLPISVNKTMNYYDENGEPITEQEFYDDRQNGRKALRTPAGNDFVKNMVENVIRTEGHIDSKDRYFIPNDETLNYCTNNVASMFLLAGIGAHLGIDALGYEQQFYENGQLKDDCGDFNMPALATWYQWAEKVTDKSTYSTNGYHLDKNGNSVFHKAGETVEMFFAANAYIYQLVTLENILSNIAVAGRAVYTRDQKNRITVVVDKPEKYPVALINQQNTIKSSYTISFSELPSGLQITFPDEADGYQQNQLYCMRDGENSERPRSQIEQYKLNYVTNNYQMWSLGRYLLANRVLNREVVTKTVGIEGSSIGLGNLVLLQDDTMLIGTDNGGRITELIENDNAIFGFIINSTFKYTGEEEEYEENGETKTRCKQGVVVMQPSKYQESRVITLRLAKKNTAIVVNDVTYKMKKGNTNLVLFDVGISKSDNYQSIDGSSYFVYKPAVDNIVGFGYIGQTTATYRVTKIKPDSKRNYELTLMKYQEDLYEYGEALPSFQNNMTIPDRSDEDAFALSSNVTVADLVKALAESAVLAQGQIDSTFSEVPPAPSNLTADVSQDCIQLACTVDTDKVNNVDHITYEITKYRVNNGEVESAVETIDGSYSTEYYFNRSWEGYPEKKASGVEENDGSLDFWAIRAKAVTIYLDDNGDKIESEWSEFVHLSASSLLAYGTWIPPIPSSISFLAEQEGITATWVCDTTNVYGSVQYEVTTSYNGTQRGTQVVITKAATYQFNRSVDGYPEKPNTVGMKIGTLTLDNYTVRIRATNVTSSKYSESSSVTCDYSKYKTWIPANPSISARVSNRNVTLYLSQGGDCYGVIEYLVGVRRYDDPADTFYVPDLETNPYSRESAYKLIQNGVFVVGHIESETQFTQTMPLETQNGTQGMLDHNDSEQDNRVLAVPVEGSSDNRILSLALGGFAPIDTSYQFEVYAFNKTVESFYDSLSVVDHAYSKDTYHKVSIENARKNCVALATSVQDVLNGSIVSDKVGVGAITETKIEDDAISSPKIQANAVTTDKLYAYNMVSLHDGTHAISGFAAHPETDEEFFDYITTIKKNRDDTSKIDSYIKSHSNNYWIGLDTNYPEFYMGNVTVGNKWREEANYFHYYTANGETSLDIKLSNFIVTAVTSTIKGFFNVRNKNGAIKYTGANSFLQVNPESSSFTEDTVRGYYDSVTDRFYEESTFQTETEPDATVVFVDIATEKAYRWRTVDDSGYYVEIQNYNGTVNAETMVLLGNLVLGKKNSDSTNGKLTVQGETETGVLTVKGNATAETNLYVGTQATESGLLKVRGTTETNLLTVGNTTSPSSSTVLQVGGKSQFLEDVTVGQNNTSSNKYVRIYGNLFVSKQVHIEGSTSILGTLGANDIDTNEIRVSSITPVYGSESLSITGEVSVSSLITSRLRIPQGAPSNPQVGDIWLE